MATSAVLVIIAAMLLIMSAAVFLAAAAADDHDRDHDEEAFKRPSLPSPYRKLHSRFLDDAPKNVTAHTTFYGSRDNCPPGGDIAHPVIHKLAGGNGTYDNPITFAGDTVATPAGTKIYYFLRQKYFIMEDDCEECQHDWKTKKEYHFDMWIGPDTLTKGPNLVACEDALTRSGETIEINPSPLYKVDPRPLFDATTSTCIIHTDPCTDKVCFKP